MHRRIGVRVAALVGKASEPLRFGGGVEVKYFAVILLVALGLCYFLFPGLPWQIGYVLSPHARVVTPGREGCDTISLGQDAPPFGLRHDVIRGSSGWWGGETPMPDVDLLPPSVGGLVMMTIGEPMDTTRAPAAQCRRAQIGDNDHQLLCDRPITDHAMFTAYFVDGTPNAEALTEQLAQQVLTTFMCTPNTPVQR